MCNQQTPRPTIKAKIRVFIDEYSKDAYEANFDIQIVSGRGGNLALQIPYHGINVWVEKAAKNLAIRRLSASPSDPELLNKIQIIEENPPIVLTTAHGDGQVDDQNIIDEIVLLDTEAEPPAQEDFQLPREIPRIDTQIDESPRQDTPLPPVGDLPTQNTDEILIHQSLIHAPSRETRLWIRHEALLSARKHAGRDRSKETGGVLLGCFVERPDDTLDVYVTGIVEAIHTIREASAVKFTPQAWAEIWKNIDQDPIYKDDRLWTVVGWYHTHPGFGIFLSQMDQFIQREFFTHPGHLALVIDPIDNKYGWFGWDKTYQSVGEVPEALIRYVKDKSTLDLLQKHTSYSDKHLPESKIPTSTVKEAGDENER